METPLLEEGEIRRSPSKRDIERLPDLHAKLKEHGLHEEYVAFREGYMRWRKGEASGAKGQLDDLVKRSQAFQHWYPTVGAFNFRRTISFWGGALQAEGSLLFLWVAFFDVRGRAFPGLIYCLTKLPNLLAGTAYLAGIYLTYFELINLNSDLDTDVRNFLWCDWGALMKLGIEVTSLIAASMNLIGACFYSFSQICDLFNPAADLQAQLVDWPLIIGGVSFFIAGVCELLINRIYKKWPTTLVWWVSVGNCIGGWCFWVSACPSVFSGNDAILVGAIGCASYLFSGLLSILMWRGEQFGTTLIPALNIASRENCHNIVVQKDRKTGVCRIIATPTSSTLKTGSSPLGEVLNPRLTWSGLLFLFFYILIGVMQMVAACACISQTWAFREGPKLRKTWSKFVADACNVVLVHMVLLLHSACISFPKKSEQPYHLLYLVMRILSVVFMANSLLAMQVSLRDDLRAV